MSAQEHKPTKLEFHSLSIYSWSMSGSNATFQSNKGHQVSCKLLDSELEVIKTFIDAARLRAMKELPEMIAEVIAEERVAQILAKREAELIESKPSAPVDDEILF